MMSYTLLTQPTGISTQESSCAFSFTNFTRPLREGLHDLSMKCMELKEKVQVIWDWSGPEGEWKMRTDSSIKKLQSDVAELRVRESTDRAGEEVKSRCDCFEQEVQEMRAELRDLSNANNETEMKCEKLAAAIADRAKPSGAELSPAKGSDAVEMHADKPEGNIGEKLSNVKVHTTNDLTAVLDDLKRSNIQMREQLETERVQRMVEQQWREALERRVIYLEKARISTGELD